MHDKIVKSNEEGLHNQHLSRVLRRVWQYNMRLNPKKCTFGVRANKFLGFYLTEIGIKANLDKWKMVIWKETPTIKIGSREVDRDANSFE